MTKIKLCGLSRACDIEIANILKPEYIGFVFASGSRRCVTAQKAQELKRLLIPGIETVGVFVDESPKTVANLLNYGMIDMAQLHGSEDEDYIRCLRKLTDRPIIKAFRVAVKSDVAQAQKSRADYILLDSGAGTGTVFDWNLIKNIERPYFLAGGLNCGNVGAAVRQCNPYAVDVSSGIETDGWKEKGKMAEFVTAVRKGGKL